VISPKAIGAFLCEKVLRGLVVVQSSPIGSVRTNLGQLASDVLFDCGEASIVSGPIGPGYSQATMSLDSRP
jgi:hypothetical protein